MPEPYAQTPQTPTPTPKKGRGRGLRIFRHSVRITVGVPLALALLTLIMMRSPAVGWLLKSSVRQLTGCELEISGAYISLDGRLVVRDFALVAPGVPGEAAKFLSAKRAAVDLVWTRALLGEVRVEAVGLVEPVFVLSQSSVDGSVNIAALRAAAGSGGGALPATLPTLDVVGGRIDFTEHDAAGTPSLLRRVTVDGSITPRGGGPGVYTVRLQETGRRGMLMSGWVDLLAGSASVKLSNVALDPWRGEAVPAAYRDIWNRLNIQGRIASTTLDYDTTGGPKASVVLDGVSMNALLPVESGSGEGGRDLRLSQVRGSVVFSKAGLSADLAGVIEGQKGVSRLRLDTLGLSAEAPLRATLSARRVSLTKDPEFLPYMPERAREYFQAFSGPTGELDIRLTISRTGATKGSPGNVSVSDGRVGLTGGTAAFHRFPYPFSDISGVFEFNDQEVRIVGLQGKGPTGARMTTTGIITPLTEESMIDITVKAENVPVDQALMDAMPADRRRVVEQVFSRSAYERLTQAGVIRALTMSGGGAEVGPRPPEFVLGGPADVSVHVFSPKGKDAPWFTTVDVSFAEAGILAEALPLPVIARDLKIRVTDDDAKVLGGTLSTLSGGSVELSAAVVFREKGVKVTKPDVRVKVRDLPVDRFLLSAVAAAGERKLGEGQPGPLARIADLRLGGVIGADLRLVEGEKIAVAGDEPPDVEYELAVDVSRVTASPLVGMAETGFDLRLGAGSVLLDKRRVRASGVGIELVDAGGTAARVVVDGELGLEAAGPERRGRLEARLGFEGLDLGRPLERLLASAAPEAAASIAELRRSRRPAGRVWGSASVTRAGEGATPAFDLRVGQGRDVSVTLLSGRLGVSWEDGAAWMRTRGDGRPRVGFDRVPAMVSFDARPCGGIELNGEMGLDLESGRVLGPADLSAALSGWRLESPIIGPMLERFAGAGAAAKYAKLEPAGGVDAALRLRSREEAPDGPLEFVAEVRPRELALTLEGQRVVLPRIGGLITLATTTGGDPNTPRVISGRVVGLDARSERWGVRADGEWGVRPGSGDQRLIDLGLRVEADVDAIDPALRAILPTQASKAVDALEVKLERPLLLRDGRLELVLGASEGPDGKAASGPARFAGTLLFEDLAFNIGLPVTGADGLIVMNVDDPGGAAPTAFDMRLEARRLAVSGVRVGEAQAVVRSTGRAGEIAVDPLVARVHGGRVAGSARASVGEGGGGAAYELDLLMTGVHLAPVLKDVQVDPGAGDGAQAVGPDLDPSRGVVDARLTLSGVAGEGSRRRGSGAIRIADGDVLKLPIVLPLIQLSNFQIPSRDRLSYVQSSFHVAGERAVFDRIAVLSRSIAIVGSGSLYVPDMTVDMRFNSRGNVRVPLISDVFDAVRNEIITTRITGKLADPKVSSETLSGTRQLIEGAFTTRGPTDVPPPGMPAVDPWEELERLRKAGGPGARAEQPVE